MKNLMKLILATTSLTLFMPTNKSSAQTYFSYDFSGNGNFNFDYGSWSLPGSLTPGPAYITVDAPATSLGGAGFGFAPLDLTLTPPASTFLTITARLLPNHNGSDLRLVLSDGAEDRVWAASAALFNTSTFTTVFIPLSTPPVFANPNINPINFAAITSYQLQGDFFTPGDFAVEVESMSIIPEPKSVALITATLLLSGIFVARRRMRKCARISVAT